MPDLFPSINRILLLLMLVPISLAGCTSDKEKLNEVCSKLQEASRMTDDCDAMAKKVVPLTEKFDSLIARLNSNTLDESQRAGYINAVSLCIRAYIEISTGSCGNEDAVKKAIPKGT